MEEQAAERAAEVPALQAGEGVAEAEVGAVAVQGWEAAPPEEEVVVAPLEA